MLDKKTESVMTDSQKKHYKMLKTWFDNNPEIYEEFKLGWMRDNLEEYVSEYIQDKPDIIIDLAEDMEYPNVDKMIDEAQNHHIKFRIQ